MPLFRRHGAVGVEFGSDVRQGLRFCSTESFGIALLAQVFPSLDQRVVLLVAGEAHQQCGGLTIGADDGIAEDRAVDQLFPRGRQIDTRRQDSIVVLGDAEQFGVTEDGHIQQAVYGFHARNIQQFVTQRTEGCEGLRAEQIGPGREGDGDCITGAIAIVDLPGVFELLVAFHEQ